jgi:hypothetical protein
MFRVKIQREINHKWFFFNPIYAYGLHVCSKQFTFYYIVFSSENTFDTLTIYVKYT